MQIFIAFFICGVVAGQHEMETNKNYSIPDGFSFPGKTSRYYFKNQNEPSELAKSIALARRIDMLESVDEFLNMVEGVPKNELDLSIHSRMGEKSSNIERTIPARCEPELQPVAFGVNENDHSINYFPSCTRVKRCGGCCSHPLTSCQPENIKLVNFEVTVTKFGVGQSIIWNRKEIMALEVHESCSCACKIKAKDCTSSQVYISDECRCVCMNSDEEIKCKADSNLKIWNAQTCSCECRRIEPCNTGDYFDPNICRCREILISGWQDNNAFSSPRHAPKIGNNPSVIVPPNAQDPRRKHKDEPH